MAFTSVTVTHSWTDGTGAPLTGFVSFKLTAPMTNGTTTIEPTDIIAPLSSGAISQALAANDDTATTSDGAEWQVFFQIDGVRLESWTFVLPHAASPTVDLYTLMPNTEQVY